MASARSVLLLGASGSFGPALADALGSRVAARTYFSRPVAGGVRFDAQSTPLSSLPTASVAVILLGETNIDACARDPGRSAQVNVAGVQRVVRELCARGIKPVFVSSDAVFDGSRSYWTEDDEPRPILTYGRQKLEVERFLWSLAPPWMIVRLPKLLSPMLAQWAADLGEDKQIKCATDQFFTPAEPADAARAIVALLDQQAQGLYHVAGPERLSRLELLQAMLGEYRKFAAPRAAIVECSLRDIDVAEPRPLDTSMRSSRLRSLRMPTMASPSAAARLAVQRHFTES